MSDNASQTESLSNFLQVESSSVNKALASTTKPTSGPDEVAAMDTVGSMAQLKDAHPDLYHTMLKSLAEAMVREMQHHSDRLKKIIRNQQY